VTSRATGPSLVRLLWVPIVAVIAVLIAIGLLGPAGGGGGGTPADFAAFLAFVLSFSSVGAMVAAKRPEHPIGWLLLGSASCYAVGGAAVTLQVPAGGGVTPSVILAWAGAWSWGIGVGLAVIVLLVFPDGRLPSRRWRPVLWLTVGAIVAFVAGVGFGSPTIGDGSLPNPFALAGPLAGPVGALAAVFPLILVLALVAVASILMRFRRSHGAERQQVKWFLYAAMVVGVGLLAQVPVFILISDPAAAMNVSNAIVTGTLAALPVAIGIAVLRYRLYDIDRIVSRTVSYGVVTGLLAVLFAGLVLALQAVLAPFTAGNGLAVAASTLVVAATFQPLRGRVQRVVDRRFDRSRYDAEAVVARLADRLRDQTDFETILSVVVGGVDEVLQPASAGLWVREGSER
jgi:hypothetical protein